MSAELAFLIGLCTTVALCSLAVTHLRAPLRKILTDLCGNENRATFWVAFSTIVLLCVPLIFALRTYPSQGLLQGAVFAVSDQVESGLIGLAVSTIVLGLVLSHFIAHGHTESK